MKERRTVVITLTPYEAETLFLGASNFWNPPWRLGALSRILRQIHKARSRAGCFRKVGSK
jgi:hypothetical protein